MLFKSQVFTQASGSIGGQTFSHNRGGMYTRARAIPVNPNTTQQQTVRAVFGSLSQRWSQSLSDTQRDGWDSYAALTPVTNRLGDELILSGQQMYVRCNTLILQGSDTVVDDGPTIPGNAALQTVVGSDNAGDFDVAFDVGDLWANQDDGALVIQTSRNLSPAINYFKGPFRFHSITTGITSGGAVSPTTLTVNAFGVAFEAGLRTYVRVRCYQEDGRISAEQIVNVLF